MNTDEVGYIIWTECQMKGNPNDAETDAELWKKRNEYVKLEQARVSISWREEEDIHPACNCHLHLTILTTLQITTSFVV
jgi:hypothetical protein